jgi:hypothetical protein
MFEMSKTVRVEIVATEVVNRVASVVVDVPDDVDLVELEVDLLEQFATDLSDAGLLEWNTTGSPKFEVEESSVEQVSDGTPVVASFRINDDGRLELVR